MTDHILRIKLDSQQYQHVSDMARGQGTTIEGFIIDALMRTGSQKNDAPKTYFVDAGGSLDSAGGTDSDGEGS